MTTTKAKKIVLQLVKGNEEQNMRKCTFVARLEIPLPDELQDVVVKDGECIHAFSLSHVYNFRVVIITPNPKMGTTYLLTKTTRCFIELYSDVTLMSFIHSFLPDVDLERIFKGVLSFKDSVFIPLGLVEFTLLDRVFLEVMNILKATRTLFKFVHVHPTVFQNLMRLLSQQIFRHGTILSQGEVWLRVQDAQERDVGKGKARLGEHIMEQIGINVGDVVEIKGKKTTGAIAWPSYIKDQNGAIIRLDEITRRNAGVSVNESVKIKKAEIVIAKSVTLVPINMVISTKYHDKIRFTLLGVPVTKGDQVLALGFDWNVPFIVKSTMPEGIVLITDKTKIVLDTTPPSDGELQLQQLQADMGRFKDILNALNQQINVTQFLDAISNYFIGTKDVKFTNDEEAAIFLIQLIGLIKFTSQLPDFNDSLGFDIKTDVLASDPFLQLGITSLFFKEMIRLSYHVSKELVSSSTTEAALHVSTLAKEIDTEWVTSTLHFLQDYQLGIFNAMEGEKGGLLDELNRELRQLEKKLLQLSFLLEEESLRRAWFTSSFVSTQWALMTLDEVLLRNVRHSLIANVLESDIIRILAQYFNPLIDAHLPYILFYLKSNLQFHRWQLEKAVIVLQIATSIRYRIIHQTLKKFQKRQKMMKDFFKDVKNVILRHRDEM